MRRERRQRRESPPETRRSRSDAAVNSPAEQTPQGASPLRDIGLRRAPGLCLPRGASDSWAKMPEETFAIGPGDVFQSATALVAKRSSGKASLGDADPRLCRG